MTFQHLARGTHSEMGTEQFCALPRGLILHPPYPEGGGYIWAREGGAASSLSLTGCETSAKSLTHSETQFPHLQSGDGCRPSILRVFCWPQGHFRDSRKSRPGSIFCLPSCFPEKPQNNGQRCWSVPVWVPPWFPCRYRVWGLPVARPRTTAALGLRSQREGQNRGPKPQLV